MLGTHPLRGRPEPVRVGPGLRRGKLLTASARCRKWLAVIDGPLCRLRLPLPTARGHNVRNLLSIRAPSVKPSFVFAAGSARPPFQWAASRLRAPIRRAEPVLIERQRFCATDEHRTRLLPSSALLTAQVGQARLGCHPKGRSEAEQPALAGLTTIIDRAIATTGRRIPV